MAAKDQVTEKLRSMGYDAVNDSGVVVVKTPSPDIEVVKKNIMKIFEEINYNSSWGITGVAGPQKDTVSRDADILSYESDAGSGQRDFVL